MTLAEIKTKVISIIVAKLGVDESEITPEAHFVNDLHADSLDSIEMVMEFEKAFSVSIPDEDAEKITNLSQAMSYLCSKLGVELAEA